MKLAICLISCGRHDLTAQAVDTLLAMNPGLAGRADVCLLQADEPSQGACSAFHGARGGFTMVHAPARRHGLTDALRALVSHAQILDATHVLWLENDWVSHGPIPWEAIAGPYDTVRLFGDWKRLDHDHPRAPAGPHLLGTKRRIHWTPHRDLEGWEHGLASWAAGGSIIRLGHLLRHRDQANLKRMMDAMGPLATLRPTWNVMASIGDETTPGFIP